MCSGEESEQMNSEQNLNVRKWMLFDASSVDKNSMAFSERLSKHWKVPGTCPKAMLDMLLLFFSFHTCFER